MKRKQKPAVVITGATSGIGLATAAGLAERGYTVIGTGRSVPRCETAKSDIKLNYPEADITFITADLSSQKVVFTLGKTIIETLGEERGLDVLIHNAGTFSNWYKQTEDGVELQFAVNFLAPFALTHTLLPQLSKAADPRVITVSSSSHFRGHMHWNDVNLHRKYGGLTAYSQSKLATVLFTAESNRLFHEDLGIRFFAADPGLVKTDIGLKGTSGLAKRVWQYRMQFGKTPEEGAETSIFLADSEEPNREPLCSHYWKYCKVLEPAKRSRSAADAKRLWELAEKMTGMTTAKVLNSLGNPGDNA